MEDEPVGHRDTDLRVADIAARVLVLEAAGIASTAVHSDHEHRLRVLERVAWSTLGTAGITFLAVAVRLVAELIVKGGPVSGGGP